jgi:hypothetical protein
MNMRHLAFALTLLGLLIPIVASAQVEGTIRDVDGKDIYLDRGSAHGLSKGQVCDVFEADGTHVGSIYIKEISENSAEALSLGGRGTVEPGQIFRSRKEELKTAILLEVVQVPAESTFGREYAALNPQSNAPQISSAQGIRLGIGGVSELGAASIGGGLFKLEDMNVPFLDFDMAFTMLTFTGRDFIYLKGRAGMFVLGKQQYERPSDQTYEDLLPNSGETNPNYQFMYGGSLGVRFVVHPNITLSAEAEWMGSGAGDDWIAADSDKVEIGSEYVEYSGISFDGVGFRAGLTVALDAFRSTN